MKKAATHRAMRRLWESAGRAAFRALPGAGGSVRVGACGLDDGAPLVDLGGHELLVLRAFDALVGDDHGAQGFLLLDELRVLQRSGF